MTANSTDAFIAECRATIEPLPEFQFLFRHKTTDNGDHITVVCSLELPRKATFISDGDILADAGWKWIPKDKYDGFARFERTAEIRKE